MTNYIPITAPTTELKRCNKVWKRVNALRRRARQPERPLLIGDQYTGGAQENADALAEDRLVGLVVKASASRAEDPGFESRLRRDFFGVESYQ